MKRSLAAILLLVWVLPVSGERIRFDPNRIWLSSTGNTIEVMQRGSAVEVTVTSPAGKRARYKGTWDGHRNSFTNFLERGYVSCTFDADDLIRAITRGKKIDEWHDDRKIDSWRRRKELAAKSAASADLAVADAIIGAWRSTSGTTVHLSSQGSKIVISMVTTAGQRMNAYGQWIQPGRKFSYVADGYPGVGTVTVVSSRQCDVIYGGTATTWHHK